MPNLPTPFRFDEIQEVPAVPGLYAWYHQISISRRDVEELAKTLNGCSDASALQLAEQFLAVHVFAPYRETNYEVTLKGPLKPEYRGEIPHRSNSSELLLSLAAKEPSALSSISKLLYRAIPVFSSPIYIGIATISLRQRLAQHARLLNQYREMTPRQHPAPEEADHSFAYDAICVRGLIPSDLLVYAMPVEFPKEVAQATEYLLNRINFPLCGRN